MYQIVKHVSSFSGKKGGATHDYTGGLYGHFCIKTTGT
jgi:hypothetical protein